MTTPHTFCPFYAHSAKGQPFAVWQLLAEHLTKVAQLAKARATGTGIQGVAEMAFATGLLHDLGKYRPEFQLYIRDDPRYRRGNPLTHHKEAGAAKAFHASQKAIALAVLGHHGGIPDGSAILAGVKDGTAVADAVQSDAETDCPSLTAALDGLPPLPKGFAADLFN